MRGKPETNVREETGLALSMLDWRKYRVTVMWFQFLGFLTMDVLRKVENRRLYKNHKVGIVIPVSTRCMGSDIKFRLTRDVIREQERSGICGIH